MKTLTALLILVASLALGSCNSEKEHVDEHPTPAPVSVDLSVLECTCGTPEAAFEGCAHPICAQGLRNPENPDCVCGPLMIGEDQ